MAHASPEPGTACASCWDDLAAESYVEFQAAEGGPWLPSKYCSTCVDYLLRTQWSVYTTALAKVTCKAEQRRLLERGPPINLRDPTALPCPDDGEVYALWFMGGNEIRSAKLEGSLVGEERRKYWDEQLSFQFDEVDENAAAAPLVGFAPTSPVAVAAGSVPASPIAVAPGSVPTSPVAAASPKPPQSPTA